MIVDACILDIMDQSGWNNINKYLVKPNIFIIIWSYSTIIEMPTYNTV
jgi:hypothetical protein